MRSRPPRPPRKAPRDLGGLWFSRLLVISFVAQFTSSSIRPLIVYESLAAGAGAAQVGLITAAFSGLALLAAVPVGKAIDRTGEIGFLIVGGIIVCAALPILVAPVNLALLAASSSALGLGHLILVIASQTLVAKGSRSEQRESRFATLTTTNAVAQIVAPLFTGMLVGNVAGTHLATSEVPNSHIVTTVNVAAMVIGTLVAVTLSIWPGALKLRPRRRSSGHRGAVVTVLRIPAVPAAMIASLTVLTTIDLLVAYLPVFGQAHGISPRTIGFLLATEGVAAMLVRLGMLRMIVRFTRRRLLIGTLTLAALSVSAIPLLAALARPEPALFLAMALAGFGLGIGQPATMAWVASQTPADLRGTAVSIRLSGNRLGQILIPITAGSLAGGLGLAVVFWFPALLLIISAALVLRTQERDSRDTATEPVHKPVSRTA